MLNTNLQYYCVVLAHVVNNFTSAYNTFRLHFNRSVLRVDYSTLAPRLVLILHTKPMLNTVFILYFY